MMARLRLCVFLFLGVVLAWPALAVGQATQRTATTTTNAPVYANPNADQSPLRVAREGSTLALLEVNGDWCHIEFQDPELGRRSGYVRTKDVRIADSSSNSEPKVSAQPNRPFTLRGIKQIDVEDTVVGNPEKVKEDFAPTLAADSLRNALRDSNFEIADSAAIRTHIVLDEFSSGSTAKRFMVGMGAGRATVEGRLIFQDQSGKELVNVKIRVRGSLMYSSYQGANTQRRQATSSFEQRLQEEIARLK